MEHAPVPIYCEAKTVTDEGTNNGQLKIDVQGAEHLVLASAPQSVAAIASVFVECSYVSLYNNQALFTQIRDQMTGSGFELVGAFNTHFNHKLGLIQADVLFRKVQS